MISFKHPDYTTFHPGYILPKAPPPFIGILMICGCTRFCAGCCACAVDKLRRIATITIDRDREIIVTLASRSAGCRYRGQNPEICARMFFYRIRERLQSVLGFSEMRNYMFCKGLDGFTVNLSGRCKHEMLHASGFQLFNPFNAFLRRASD